MPKSKQQNTNGKTKEPVEEPVMEQPWDTQPDLPANTATSHYDMATGLISGHPTPPDNWDTPATEPQDEWSGELPTADEPTGEDWGAVPTPLTLSIVQHSGRFEPHIAKIMIFGETGTHKTRFASTFPNVIFADADHGMSSVTEQVDKVFINDDKRGFRELQAMYEYLKAGDHGYETVVLDTVNEIQRIIMRFTVDEYTHIRRSYGNLPGQSDYGKMLYEFMELTRNFISLPMRVVLLAQVKTQEFDTDVLGPQLIGKNTARELARKMDVIGYIYKAAGENDETVPEIAFDSPQYVTKDRSNRLPTVLPNPTYNRVAAFWK